MGENQVRRDEEAPSGMASDVFVVGCGRSGTSLVAGLFHRAGYFVGNRLHPARPANPHGFFEDISINEVNDWVISRLTPRRDRISYSGYGFDIPERRHHWLARVPVDAPGSLTSAQIDVVLSLTRRKPFCFKDPRFCYTLDLWRPFATQPKFICIFRRPETFVASVFQECLAAPYLSNFAVSVDQLFEVWLTMHRHVLERHALSGDWLFVEYDEILAGPDLDRIAAFAGIAVDRRLPDPLLNRSRGDGIAVPPAVAEMLETLRARRSAA